MDNIKATSPKEAKALGLKRYFTGLPCKRGGVAERNINGDCLCKNCLEFTKQLKNNWVKNNKEKILAWRDANKNKMHAYKMDYQTRNRKLQNERIADWKSRNKDKVLASTHKRQSLKKKALPNWYDEFDDFVIQEAVDIAKRREKVTGFKWNVDHMIPLAGKNACGLHWYKNIQVIPQKLNLLKLNRMMFTKPLEWIKAL